MTPVEKNESTVYFNPYGDMEQLSSKPKFKVGDKVRISKYKRKKATHLTGRKRYSWSIKSNIDDPIRKLDTKIRNKETELNALYTKIQKLEKELATLYHKKLISKNWKQLKCH